jgi:DNA-directed RNA polymerase specialized sigma subunit
MTISLIDSARRVHALKRGARERETEPIEAIDIPSVEPVRIEQRVDLNRALKALARGDRLMALVVNLRFFKGMTYGEIAKALNLTLLKAYRLNVECIRFLHHQLAGWQGPSNASRF